MVKDMEKKKDSFGCKLDKWIVIDAEKIINSSRTVHGGFDTVQSVARHEFAHVLYDFIVQSDEQDEKENFKTILADSEDFADRLEVIYGIPFKRPEEKKE